MTSTHDIVITRGFDAPRELVFDAWTDSERLKEWWEPNGCETTHVSVDLRVGGLFRFCMRVPDGRGIWLRCVYREIVRPERLVYTEAFSDADGHVVPPSYYGWSALYPTTSMVTVTFEVSGGGTVVTLRHALPAAFDERDSKARGWAEMFDRLGQYFVGVRAGESQYHRRKEGSVAATDPSGTSETTRTDWSIEIARHFDAPRERVFAAFTNAEELKRWWAPHGCSTPYCTVDLRVGGIFHNCMRLPDGREIWARCVYREIVVPLRLVFTDTFSDAEGNVVPPSHYGMSAGHPAETVVTITFEEQDGGTLVTLRHALPGAFEERAGMTQGWSEMFDRLVEILPDAG